MDNCRPHFPDCQEPLAMTDRVQRPTLYFEDIELGVTAVTEPIYVFEDEMIAFARHWDPMPIHIDRDAAAKSQFGGITASSVYTMGLKNLLVKQLINEESVICLLGFSDGRLPAALKADRAVRLHPPTDTLS
jgi:acyl dehydratase